MSIALTIAGSDSGGGAGIQADLKTFAAFGVYGCSAVTAVTAQNTVGVTNIFEIPNQVIEDQIFAVMDDIVPNAIKIGMLSNIAIINTVAQCLTKIKKTNYVKVVLDPVMVAKGGDRLLEENAVNELKELMIPLSDVITPNIPEAETLVKFSIKNDDDLKNAARFIVDKLGAGSVVIKGGHRTDNKCDDVYFDGHDFQILSAERIQTKNTHGTGCTFAAALTANLALNLSISDILHRSKSYVNECIINAKPIGQGHGPLNHFPFLNN
ncbi:MAG: bifunctional hydroxymethylpyrimidine kinase/phosphomethylpyrimidine kinase [Chloroflexi bacterium]|nr:bifunctional hydroxymethylpyrimidine kinase/phosphomethylpyrimidine kinase [Chloroflexota bacterium]|tara:strand:- start:8563 stop:9363 length:801 start_codon:yes stop_codon:yes gene_type:complete